MMKKLLLSFMALMPIAAAAQETGQSDPLKVLNEAAEAVETAPKVEVEATPAPRYWKNSLQTKLDFGQTSLTGTTACSWITVSCIRQTSRYSRKATTGSIWRASGDIRQRTSSIIP